VGLKKLRKMKNKDLNSLFVTFFEDNRFENLSKMIDTWAKNEFFKRRMKIIRDSFLLLQKHRKKGKNVEINPCNMIIPVLIAQIDGITLDIAIEIGFTPKEKSASKFVSKDGTEINKISILEELYFNSFHDVSSLYLFQDYLFSKAYPTEKPEKTIKKRPFLSFSRHKVLHGENVKYGTIDNTIRLFLVLDFIANLKLDVNDSN
jgi:hypothetical protein